MTDWQSMAQAPKDGTRILAWVSNKSDEPNICEVWWVEDYLEGEWGNIEGGWGDDWDLGHDPKAWMPKPTPPSLSAQEGE